MKEDVLDDTLVDFDEDDAPELTEEWFQKAKPFRQFYDEKFGVGSADAFLEAVEELRKTRGKQKAPLKERLSIRLDSDIVEHFRGTGRGWQSRLNEALRHSITTH